MKRFLTKVVHEACEAITPVATQSTFSQTGQLTPSEFVSAGDYLTSKWCFWTWETSSRSRAYLPLDKQYLQTRGIVSKMRYKDGQCTLSQTLVEGHGFDYISMPPTDDKDEDVSGKQKEAVQQVKGDVQTESYSRSEWSEHDDILSEMEEVIEEDDCAVIGTTTSKVNAWRTYDLHITYDNYYRTPRLWIIGYDIFGNRLTYQEIFEDISPEHSKSTVTWEEHPFVPSLYCLSVHPCKHASMLKKLCQLTQAENSVQTVLEIFLRFIVTVLPTADFLARGMD